MNVNLDYSFIKKRDLVNLENKIKEVASAFENGNCVGNEYIGWGKYPTNIDVNMINKIKNDADFIANNCDVFVVCGIGGSYLGPRAVIEAINGFRFKGVEIVYLGNTFDERYTTDVLDYLKDKRIFVNVISKSGSTMETAFAFRKLKEMLKDRYGENYYKYIIATTDSEKGCLRQMVNMENYNSYVIPSDIGGRYSVFTPVGLLPIAVAGLDIEMFIKGACQARENVLNNKFEENDAYMYAAYRYLNYLEGKQIELFASYTPYLGMFAEWCKQLFGESEGKDGKGLFPASVTFSTDLHSLGQYIQQGRKNLFITQIKINKKGKLKMRLDDLDLDNLNCINDTTLSELNLKAQMGTNKAHHEIGCVNNIIFEIDDINEYTIGYVMYSFMYSCMICGYLMEVNPFNQPGVEFYKKEMKKLL